MGLQALKIVEEEFAKEGDKAFASLAQLGKLRERIVSRIEKECIERPCPKPPRRVRPHRGRGHSKPPCTCRLCILQAPLMCHHCDQSRAEDKRAAEAEGCIRFVCICGNLLGRRNLIRGYEEPYTVRTVGPCCTHILPAQSQAFTVDPDFINITPGSFDQRAAKRAEDDPGAKLGKD